MKSKILEKKIIIALLCLSFAFGVNSTHVYAHELIPQALKEYVQQHPNATPEEIMQYAKDQSPEFAAKYRNGAEVLRIARQQNTSILDNIFDFFKLGVRHILSGTDHILFVLSLLLFFVSLKQMFKLTAAFTVAHSITLVLAGTGILVLSSRVVEPMIALSIAFVALTSVFFKDKKIFGINIAGNKGKIATVFFFGLFHGLGFAGLLKEIQVPADKFISSLFAFNLGIEGGQLIIIALAFPFIYFFKDTTWYPKLMKIFGIIISIIAIFWFFQRLLGQ